MISLVSSGGFRGQPEAIAPPRPVETGLAAPFENVAPIFEELTLDIHVEQKTPHYQLPPSDLL